MVTALAFLPIQEGRFGPRLRTWPDLRPVSATLLWHTSIGPMADSLIPQIYCLEGPAADPANAVAADEPKLEDEGRSPSEAEASKCLSQRRGHNEGRSPSAAEADAASKCLSEPEERP